MNALEHIELDTNITCIDAFSQYMKMIESIPLLSQEEEYDLATNYRLNNDIDSAKRLIQSNLRFVVYMAKKYNGYGLSLPDLVQEGNVGLMKAVKRFDPEQGVRLVTFAVHWIKASFYDYIMKNQSIVKISGSKNERKLFFNLRKMKKSTTWLDNQEANDIALKLNVPVKEVLDMEQRLSATDISFNLDYDDEELSYSPEAHLEDYRYSPDKLIESKDTEETNSANLYEALETLDERSKDIIQRRWLNEDKPTLHELAAEYGVSHERIRQIENSAMKKIKVFLSEL